MSMGKAQLGRWLKAMVSTLPHGGKRKAADMLGLSQSGLSKLLNEPGRGFDEKTLRAVAWLEMSKSDKYPATEFPILREQVVDGLVIETRRHPSGTDFVAWRVAK